MDERKDVLLLGTTIYFSNALACTLGDANQAAILQQVFWWMCLAKEDDTGRIGKFEDGRWWTYQEMRSWRKRFSWMSRKTLQRTRKKLEDKGVLLRKDEADPDAPGGVRVWLSVDRDCLEQLQDEYLATLENEDNGDEEGYPNVGPIPPKNYDNVGEDRSQHGTPFTNIHKQTGSSIHSGSAAPPADAVGAATPNPPARGQQKAPTQGQSYIQSIMGDTNDQHDRADEIPAVPEGQGKGRVNPTELSGLGQWIVHMSGKRSRSKVPTKSLTRNQAHRLNTELHFFFAGKEITTTPNEVYDENPELMRRWLEREVYVKLFSRFARKQGGTISRDMLIDAVTLEGGQGFDIRDYYRWRDMEQRLERSNVPLPVAPLPGDGPLTTKAGALSLEELLADYEDETEGSADNDEQE